MVRFLNAWLQPVLFLFFVSCCVYKIHSAHSATGVGVARQYVPGTLYIYKVSDMDFGVAAPGAARYRMPNVNEENAENASFRIQGEPRDTVTTTFPTGSIFLSHATSGDQIEVRRFRSRPGGQSGGNVRIRNTGERMLFISAQRQAIPLGVAPGLYTGTFTVDVVY